MCVYEKGNSVGVLVPSLLRPSEDYDLCCFSLLSVQFPEWLLKVPAAAVNKDKQSVNLCKACFCFAAPLISGISIQPSCKTGIFQAQGTCKLLHLPLCTCISHGATQRSQCCPNTCLCFNTCGHDLCGLVQNQILTFGGRSGKSDDHPKREWTRMCPCLCLSSCTSRR